MTLDKSTIKEAIADCKHTLKITFVFNSQEGKYHLSIAYENTFPAIATYDEIPDDLDLAVLELLEEFDITSKNRIVTKAKLKGNGERKVKPINRTKKTKTKQRNTRLSKSIF